ncbi:Nidogen-2, partial [Stegodyphus mimosarum]
MLAYLLEIVYLVAFLTLVHSQHRFGCDEDYCSKQVAPCRPLNCKNGRILKNATKCGCCDICVESLKEGDNCATHDYATIPRQECGPSLTCDEKKKICVPVSTRCVKDQKKFEQESSTGKLFQRPKPKCDDFGLYEPIICIPGVLCYCVDKYGERIFGTDIYKMKDSMNCNCSRDFEEFPRDIPNGDFLRCLPNGDYDPLQCTEDFCYCINENTNVVGYIVPANTSIKDLTCYDQIRHRYDDASLRSKCWRERNSLLIQIEDYKSQGVKILGVDLPECDLDGSYVPVQCKKDSCYCVKKNGSPYEGYRVPRNSKEAKTMNCRCIREKEMISEVQTNSKELDFFKKYQCAPNGNYKQKQCVESKSFTVDEMGFQISDEVLQKPMDCV